MWPGRISMFHPWAGSQPHVFLRFCSKLPWPSSSPVCAYLNRKLYVCLPSYWRKLDLRIPVVVQQKRIQLGIMRFRVRSLASLSGLRIQRCRELWCRSQMWLGSGFAVAMVQAGSCSSNEIPSLGTSICCRCGPEKQTNKQTKNLKTNIIS